MTTRRQSAPIPNSQDAGTSVQLINRVDQVWGTDITTMRMSHGRLYLAALMDWFSRYVPAWELSTSPAVDFCLRVLDRAVHIGQPEILNSDQASQCASLDFIDRVQQHQVRISMGGRDRTRDNTLTERLWRSLEYGEVTLKDYQAVREANDGISQFLKFYNHQRLHQSLNYRRPAEVYFAERCNLNQTISCLDNGGPLSTRKSRRARSLPILARSCARGRA